MGAYSRAAAVLGGSTGVSQASQLPLGVSTQRQTHGAGDDAGAAPHGVPTMSQRMMARLADATRPRPSMAP